MKERAARGIFLVGFMGSGKSTIGRLLAVHLISVFWDLDERIENAAGRSIASLFQQEGEAGFRTIETQELKKLLGKMPLRPTTAGNVVALGGGAFAQAENRQLLKDFGGLTVFLECPIEELERRCAGYAHRPLAADPQAFRELYQERLPSYRLAHLIVDSSKSPEQAVQTILGHLT